MSSYRRIVGFVQQNVTLALMLVLLLPLTISAQTSTATPKTEWPNSDALNDALQLRRSLAPATDGLIQASNTARTLPDDLPEAGIFKPETPRYPNLWFYGLKSDFPTYAKFVEWLDTRFRSAGYSPDAVELNEGADIALSIEHLQPWTSIGRLAHAHALHIRFFWRRLEQHGLEHVTYGSRAGAYWRVAASVHYEADHSNPLHADVEVCPYCGRTGAFAAKTGNLVEHVHDPLGLELLLRGTIRGESLQPEKTFPSIERFLSTRPNEWTIARPTRPDMNTGAIALITVGKPVNLK